MVQIPKAVASSLTPSWQGWHWALAPLQRLESRHPWVRSGCTHTVWIQMPNPTGWFHEVLTSMTVGRDSENKPQQTKSFPEQFLLPQPTFLSAPLWDWSPSCPCAAITIPSVVPNTSCKGSHHNWNIKMMYKARKIFNLDHFSTTDTAEMRPCYRLGVA